MRAPIVLLMVAASLSACSPKPATPEKPAFTLDCGRGYDALANLYNGQRKFDQAGQMSQKAMAIRGASGGPADATSLFNAGVIFWNQSKIAEAKEQFQKAIQLKPDMAEAQYYYGMCLVNEGNVADAKAALQKYLQLAPTGPNAATAKSILDTMQ